MSDTVLSNWLVSRREELLTHFATVETRQTNKLSPTNAGLILKIVRFELQHKGLQEYLKQCFLNFRMQGSNQLMAY